MGEEAEASTRARGDETHVQARGCSPVQKLKEAKEAKRLKEEQAAQAELNMWVEQFESDDQPKAFVKGGTQATASRAEARGEAHAPPGPSARGPPPSLKPAAPVPRESGRPFQQRVPSAATRSMFSQDDGELELCPVPVQRPCPRGAPFARGPRRC